MRKKELKDAWQKEYLEMMEYLGKYPTQYSCLTQKKYIDYFTNLDIDYDKENISEKSIRWAKQHKKLTGVKDRYTDMMTDFADDIMNFEYLGSLDEKVNKVHNPMYHTAKIWLKLRDVYAASMDASILNEKMKQAIPLFTADETYAVLKQCEAGWYTCGKKFSDFCKSGVIGTLLEHLKYVEEEAYNQVYKGIFWIKDISDFGNSNIYCRIPVDVMGNIREKPEFALELNSKKGDNYNHRETWYELPRDMTEGKPFDYYPRGRVEVRNRKAIIYANPHICNRQLKNWAKKTFNLNTFNGIEKVTIKPDHSQHYQCYLGEDPVYVFGDNMPYK